MNLRFKVQRLNIRFIFGALILAISNAAAQQPGSTPRIAYLNAGPTDRGRIEAFRHGLRELGYVEGKNIVIEYRDAEGRLDRLGRLASDLTLLNVAVIVTGGNEASAAAKKATRVIPIVMAFSGDPVGTGLVSDLAKPGGNITGLSSFNQELTPKRLELLKEVSPTISQVSVLWHRDNPLPNRTQSQMEAAARNMQIKLEMIEARDINDLDRVFSAAAKAHLGGILFLPGGFFASNRNRVSNLAMNSRLPAIYTSLDFVEAGGLMAYAADRVAMHRRAAYYVDKILKGAKPADLPVEQPTKFELVINLKTAKQIGLTIPPNVLARADRVIK